MPMDEWMTSHRPSCITTLIMRPSRISSTWGSSQGAIEPVIHGDSYTFLMKEDPWSIKTTDYAAIAATRPVCVGLDLRMMAVHGYRPIGSHAATSCLCMTCPLRATCMPTTCMPITVQSSKRRERHFMMHAAGDRLPEMKV